MPAMPKKGVEATWERPGQWRVLVNPGITIRRRAGRWWIFGVFALGHGPFQTLSGALDAVRRVFTQ